ncbi:MAG: hypothetical protein MI784_10100, partial [Cytophagales bacterium]|nr:hypothetical protein [Cytophagales bacterium]
NKTKVMLITKENAELEDLLQYDFNKMINDIVKFRKSANPEIEVIQIEDKDGVIYRQSSYDSTAAPYDEPLPEHRSRNGKVKVKQFRSHRKKRRVWGDLSLLFDIGMNNWLEDGSFPNDEDKQYSVKNWGSWQVALGYGGDVVFGNRCISKFGDPCGSTAFILRTGLDVMWYNFKFLDPATYVVKGDEGIAFNKDLSPEKSFKKSKLTASYLNFRLVPTLSTRYFRFGVGAYGGVLLGSHTKVVYKEDGDKGRDKNRGNFYLNSWRYGLRTEIGFGSLLLYANYDLNPLFRKGKGPELHAVSVGVSLFFD